MTNDNLTLVAALLDRSGSMCNIAKDTEGGFDSFIQNLRDEAEGDVIVSLAKFDDKFEVEYMNMPIAEVNKLNLNPRGTTALLDSLGKYITQIGEGLDKLPESERPGKVIVLVMTDGHENASREFNADAIKQMVEHQTEKYNWEFVFLGANIDSITTASALGFSAERTMDYGANTRGVTSTFASTSGLVANMSRGISASYTQSDRDAAMGR